MADLQPSFEEDRPEPGSDAEFRLDLEGYEGPIDMLLGLAREQKVDLKKLSILELADQYLAYIQRARQLRLEIAADYLVMAAWLAYLKSRLLLPEPPGDAEPSGAEMAAALAFQLQRLQSMQEAGQKLMSLAQLGRDFFGRGAPEPIKILEKSVYDTKLYDLLRAYAGHVQSKQAGRLRILPTDLYSMDDVLRRFSAMLGHMLPSWQTLQAFLPDDIGLHASPIRRRSALAATFAATLELTRSGRVELRQDGAFGPIYLRAPAQPSETP
jgi:segregation and condensation protein A